MSYGDHCISSPRMCFSTQDYNEWMNKPYPNNDDDDDDDEKIVPKWFYLNLPDCDECEKYIEFVDNKCSNHRSHRTLVTCNFCQNDFKTLSSKKVRSSPCCQLNERKLETYIFRN